MRLGVKNLLKKLFEPVRNSFEVLTEACAGVEGCIEKGSKDVSHYINSTKRDLKKRGCSAYCWSSVPQRPYLSSLDIWMWSASFCGMLGVKECLAYCGVSLMNISKSRSVVP